MLKTFTGIVSFILTFGVSVSLVGLLFGFPQFDGFAVDAGTSRSAKHNIRSLLTRDVMNGLKRDQEFRVRIAENSQSSPEERVSEFHSVISTYYKGSSDMSEAGLPEDFRYAWRDHMEAWRNEVDLLAKTSRGEISQEQFGNLYRENDHKIRETWYQVLRIAERYGVNTRRWR